MKKPWSVPLLAFVLLAFAERLPAQTASPVPLAPPIRLALVSATEETRTAADLLTAEFSSRTNLQLLERDQVDKVWREQTLAAANRDPLQLGRVLGADGLLLLNIVQKHTGCFLDARLVAVKPGVVLMTAEFSWPVRDSGEWAAGFARNLEPLLPKLAILPKDAIPVSIVNLRSAIASPAAAEMENELKLLAIQRLSREPRLFVLERQKLQAAGEERELNGGTAPFWNGCYLLDGEADRNGYSPATITIDARLTPPGGGAPVTLTVRGSRTNLAEVVNALALKVAASLQLGATAPAWQAADEAQKYSDEARWALRWGSYEEAQAAADSAWALGCQTREVAGLRIAAARSFAGDPGICTIYNPDQHVNFGVPVNPRVHNISELATLVNVPDPERFARAVLAARIYVQASDNLFTPDAKPDADWAALGNRLVEQLSLWLRYYYFTAEARAGRESGLEAARQLCRDITGRLAARPEFAALDTNHATLLLTARHAAFWMDSPEQTLQLYRQWLDDGKWPLVRTRFFSATPTELAPDATHTEAIEAMPSPADPVLLANAANPCLAGWSWKDRARCPELWAGFIAEMSRSARPLTGLEGRLLQCSYSWSGAEYGKNLDALLDYLRAQEESLLAGGLDDSVPGDVALMMSKHPASPGPEAAAVTRFSEDLKKQLADAASRQAGQTVLREKIRLLDSWTNFDFIQFAQNLSGSDFPPDEARQMLPHVLQFEARITNRPPPPDTDRLARFHYQNEQWQAVTQIGFFKNQLAEIIAAATTPAKPRPPAAAPVAAAPIVHPAPPVMPAPPAPSGDALKVGRFWAIPTPPGLQTTDLGGGRFVYQLADGGNYSPQIVASRYRDGKLWLEVRYDQQGYQGHADFFKLDLATLTAEKIPFAGMDFSLPDNFEICGGFLYLPLGGAIRRCAFTNAPEAPAAAWEDFPVPAAGSGPCRLGDRLFFTSGSSILEYTRDGSFRTLASTKRQPPRTVLDAVADYGSLHLFLAAENTLHACIQNEVYAFAETTGDWHLVGRLPRLYPGKSYGFADGFLTGTGNNGDDWWGMIGTATRPEYLLHQPSGQPGYEPAMMLSQPGTVPTPAARPYWTAPAPGMECFSHDGCLWFLAGEPRLGMAALMNFNSRAGSPGGNPPPTGLSLVRFQRGESQPVTLPLQFDPQAEVLPPAAAAAATSLPLDRLTRPWQHQWNFEWAPAGLVLFRQAGPGFWFIPARELDAAVTRAQSGQVAQQVALAALHERWRRELLATYDLNHDGVFQPEERLAMIDNPHYLELELPHIDANTNGLLDPAELKFFDVRQNGVLESRAQTAIGQTLALLADRLLVQMGGDAAGQANPENLPAELKQIYYSPMLGGQSHIHYADPNQAIKIGRDELVRLLRTLLSRELRRPGRFPAQTWQPFHLPAAHPGQPVNEEAIFKALVENYWQPTGTSPATP